MSVRTMAAVWERSSHSGSELLMLLAIADFSDDDGRAYPSVSTLATKCRTAPRYAMKLLEALSASGELEIRKNQGPMGRGGRTNLYRVAVERMRPATDKAVTQSSGVQASEAVNSGAVVNRESGVTSGSRSGEPGFREVVNQRSPKPSRNHQEPPKDARKRADRFDATAIELPDWLPKAVWSAWVADRRERRKPITSRAAPQHIAALAALREQGHAPAAVIDNCIAKGWQGIYPPRGEGATAAQRPVLAADDYFEGAI